MRLILFERHDLALLGALIVTADDWQLLSVLLQRLEEASRLLLDPAARADCLPAHLTLPLVKAVLAADGSLALAADLGLVRETEANQALKVLVN